MELEGRKELVDTGKSSGTWSVPTVSLRLAVLNVFKGFFGPKMAVFGPKLQFLKLRSATCGSRSRPPPLSFLLKLCVIVLHTHRYHPPKFHLNPKHHDGVLIWLEFRRREYSPTEWHCVGRDVYEHNDFKMLWDILLDLLYTCLQQVVMW